MKARGPHGGAEERAAGAGARSDHGRWAPGWAGSPGGCRGGGGGRRVPGVPAGGAEGRLHAARGGVVVSEPPGTPREAGSVGEHPGRVDPPARD